MCYFISVSFRFQLSVQSIDLIGDVDVYINVFPERLQIIAANRSKEATTIKKAPNENKLIEAINIYCIFVVALVFSTQ